jgi:uncharacterized NAD(P)/FAD-binding protein YdhS
MRAATVSIDPADPEQFANWLQKHLSDLLESDIEYPPRFYFGRYISHELAKAIETAESTGLRIEHWRTRAVDIMSVGNCFQVTAETGETQSFATLILAVGESQYGALGHYEREQNFVASPWATRQIEDMPSKARVAIAGSSLSAVDVCVQLLAQKHQGSITCLSRTRGLPKVQGKHLTYVPSIIDDRWMQRATRRGAAMLSLRQILVAVKAELDNCMLERYEPGATDPREWFCPKGRRLRRQRAENDVFRQSVLSAAETGTPWYYALDSLSPIVPRIWNCLDKADQLHFLRAHRAQWNEYRHSMPMVNALQLIPATTSGQIVVQSRLRDVRPVTSGPSRSWNIVAGSRGSEQSWDFLIDATGGRISIACQRDPLLAACLRRGLLTLDRREGIQVDFGTCRAIDACGDSNDNLYFVGPMTFGTHFYTNSFEINRDNAFKVAQHVAANLRSVESRSPASSRVAERGP